MSHKTPTRNRGAPIRIFTLLMIFILVLIGLCINGLIHTGETHVQATVDYKCCDMTTADHHEIVSLAMLSAAPLLPAVFILFVLITFPSPLVRQRFINNYSPYFLHKFSRGVLQLE